MIRIFFIGCYLKLNLIFNYSNSGSLDFGYVILPCISILTTFLLLTQRFFFFNLGTIYIL